MKFYFRYCCVIDIIVIIVVIILIMALSTALFEYFCWCFSFVDLKNDSTFIGILSLLYSCCHYLPVSLPCLNPPSSALLWYFLLIVFLVLILVFILEWYLLLIVEVLSSSFSSLVSSLTAAATRERWSSMSEIFDTASIVLASYIDS